MKMDKALKRKIGFEYVPMAITGIGVLICAIVFKQMLIKVLPLFFSLIIMLLNARANRIGFLLGAINSVIYIIGYLMEGVYGTVAQTLFGVVMSLITYFRWKKDAYGKATNFRAFSTKGRILLTLVIGIAWATSSFVLWKMGGTAVVLDGFTMVLGFTVNILNIWAYIETPLLNVLNCFIQFVMWVQIVFANGNFAATTYLIYSVYCMYMVARTAFRWIALYKEQRLKGKQEPLKEKI